MRIFPLSKLSQMLPRWVTLLLLLCAIDTASGSCAADFYGQEGETCTKCPERSTSIPGSTLQSACVCMAGYVGPIDGKCVPCGTNTYKAKDIYDLVRLETPYIVSKAVDWNNATGQFDSLCGVEACAGNTGYLESGAVTTGTVPGHGAASPVAFVGGDVNSKMQWGKLSVPVTFTVCSVTRYSGESNGRILSCLDNPEGNRNWFNGNWAGKAGSTNLGGKFTMYSITPYSNWAVTCSRNLLQNDTAGVIVNNFQTSTAIGGIGECAMGINYHQPSDWQFSKVYMWDYHLSDSDFALASSSLYDSILTGNQEAMCSACDPNANSVVGSVTVLNCKCNPGFTGTDGGTCSQCAAGRYSEPIGQVKTVHTCKLYGVMYGLYMSGKEFPAVGYTHNTINNFIIFVQRGSTYFKMTGVLFTDALVSRNPVSIGDRYIILPSNTVLDNAKVSNMWSGNFTGYTTNLINRNDAYDVKEIRFDCCNVCPSNSNSAVQSTAVTACQCNAGFTGPDGGPCTACAAGKFKPLPGPAECETCPTNSDSFEGASMQTDCKCSPGFSGTDGDVCTVCATGTYRAGNFMTNWARACGNMRNEACAATQTGVRYGGIPELAVDGNSNGYCSTSAPNDPAWWSVDLGLTHRITTLRITGNNDGHRTSGYSIYIGDDNSDTGRFTQNSVCVSNQLQLPSTALNITCNQPISGRYVYFMLSKGEFLSLCEVEVWSSACALCPANSVSLPGSVVVGDCQCNPGYTGANGSACIQCPAGFFKNVSGASACQACPAGTYGGGIYCSLCPAGTFSTGTGSTSIKSCTPCKRGTYNEIMGSDSSDMCLSCALGKFHRNLGAGSIDDCKECNCQN